MVHPDKYSIVLSSDQVHGAEDGGLLKVYSGEGGAFMCEMGRMVDT